MQMLMMVAMVGLSLSLGEPCDVELALIAPPEPSEHSLWIGAELDGPCDTDDVTWSGSDRLWVEAWRGDRSGLTAWADGMPGTHVVTATRGNYEGVLEVQIEEAPAPVPVRADWKRPGAIYAASFGLNWWTTKRAIDGGDRELNPLMPGTAGRAALIRAAQVGLLTWADVELQKRGKKKQVRGLRIFVAAICVAAAGFDALPIGRH